MRKRSYVAGYLFGLALAVVSLASAATAQTAAPKRNGKIAFVADGISSASGIWVMNPDGSDRRQLTGTTDNTRDFNPSWSPDGSQIVFMKWVNSGAWQSEIFLMNADGSNQRRLIRVGPALWMKPAWSPDGSKIAFTGWSGSQAGSLYLINADGSGRRSIGTGWNPDWSPDGTKLVVEEAGGLHVLNADGSGRTPLTAPRTLPNNHFDYDWGPAWSPDGTRIIFNRSLDFDGDHSESTTIWTVNADGSGLAKLSDIEAGYVDWSPDGTKIVFPAAANDRADLFVMNASGGGITNVTNTSGLGEYAPSWQPLDLNVPPGINPIDDAQFFVRQHYLDFLSREPDAAGLAFWTNEITSCGADAACLDHKRQHVSAAFFLSPEFQETGFYVVRAQRVAFGRRSAESATRMSRAAFAADSQQVGQGFVDGQPGSGAVLEQNKQAYAAQVVGGAEFVANFPTSLSAAEYVAALSAKAGVALTAAETQAAVDAFAAAGGGTAGRVAAFRRVTDSSSVREAEFRAAFVLMQYFGYLRRDPDQSGYEFWLTKLNNHGGDYIAAEMIRSFLASEEYRQRFGTP